MITEHPAAPKKTCREFIKEAMVRVRLPPAEVTMNLKPLSNLEKIMLRKVLLSKPDKAKSKF